MRLSSPLSVDDAGASSASTPGAADTTVTVAPSGPLSRLRRTVGPYVALTKPRVIELLLVTTLPTMILAQAGQRAARCDGHRRVSGPRGRRGGRSGVVD